MRKVGGFGMLVLVVVLGIVLLLAAKQWKAVAPTAAQIGDDGTVTVMPNDRGQTEAGQALQSGNLPDLNQMRHATGDHAQRVQEALEESE